MNIKNISETITINIIKIKLLNEIEDEIKMSDFIYRQIDYTIMAYKSDKGYMPNAILLPKIVFEELKRDCEKKSLRYITECTGDNQVFGLDIIVTLDSNEIKPVKILKKRD